MLLTAVVVDDLVTNQRYNVTLSDAETEKVEKNWNRPDVLLDGLSSTTALFSGRSTWADLRPLHFKILILRNFCHLDELTLEEKQNAKHPAIQSLYFLIAALIKSLVQHADTSLLFLKLTRLAPDRISFDYNATVLLELEGSEPLDSGLKIVVDNTKEEQ
jgi:hypothetical protein